MAYETHYAEKHVVVSAVPNFSMRTPIGFAVAAPKNIKHDMEDRVLYGSELEALLARQITLLQNNAHAFPDELVHDVLHGVDLDRDFAVALASRLNYGARPGLVNFVYYARDRPNESSSPKIVFDASIVTTRGYEVLSWNPDTTLFHRGGSPILMLDGDQQLILEQSRLKDLQARILDEFGESLREAERPCFVQNDGDFHRVLLNPAHAYLTMN
ncbi:hypothetical protein HYX06_01875 [Candidatus Woesearchaeota archaeon]|nr:hypothetical protein [Candidatus Woesearchaeota archaeon]